MKTFNNLSVVLGTLVTICMLILVEDLVGMLYFKPTDQLITDYTLFSKTLHKMPVTFYVILIICNTISHYIGSMIPVLIGDERAIRSLYVGLSVSAFALINAVIIPFPVWYKIISVVLCLPVGLLGSELTKRIVEKLVFRRLPRQL